MKNNTDLLSMIKEGCLECRYSYNGVTSYSDWDGKQERRDIKKAFMDLLEENINCVVYGDAEYFFYAVDGTKDSPPKVVITMINKTSI